MADDVIPGDDLPTVAPGIDGTEVPSADPADMVVEAAQAGVAGQDESSVEPPLDESAFVDEWWERTSETLDFKEAVARKQADMLIIMGGTEAEIADQAESTVNHVYRNTMQTVALTVPEHHSVKWSPREEVQPLPGEQMPPELIERKRQQQGIAATLAVLMKTFGDECNLQEKLEAWVQDGSHFRASVLKVWFQSDLMTDPVSDERLPDAQDNYARLNVLTREYAEGKFTKDDAKFYQMRDLMLGLGKNELRVKCGLMVEQIPLEQYRVDPAVNGPEHHYTAGWERHDVPKQRKEIPELFERVKLNDLDRCSFSRLDATGKSVKTDLGIKTATDGSTMATNAIQQGNPTCQDDDWIMVSEIYDYGSNQRITLVEGLRYVADKQPLDKQPFGNSPFVVLVLNRVPGRWYGISDTELQAKLQTSINKLRTDEEESRDCAQPRWAYDPAALEGKVVKSVRDSKPRDMIPVPISGKGTKLSDSLMPLIGNHEHSAQDFQNSRMAFLTELRAMAMLPEQALGVTGNADFAAEVNVAAAGANIMAKYRMARISRAVKRMYDKAAQLLLWNVGLDMAVKYAGPLAAKYWLQEAPDRQAVYETLKMSIDVNMDRALDYAKRTDSMTKLLQVLVDLQVPFDKELLGKLMVKYLDLGEDGQALINSDPNDLVMRLVSALQTNPQGLAPEAMVMLAQIGEQAKQQAVAMAEQQAVAEASGAGEAPVPGAAPEQTEAPVMAGAAP